MSKEPAGKCPSCGVEYFDTNQKTCPNCGYIFYQPPTEDPKNAPSKDPHRII